MTLHVKAVTAHKSYTTMGESSHLTVEYDLSEGSGGLIAKDATAIGIEWSDDTLEAMASLLKLARQDLSEALSLEDNKTTSTKIEGGKDDDTIYGGIGD